MPKLPPPTAAVDCIENTYDNILGKIDDDEASVSAECMFVDPVADIAVLQAANNQLLLDESDNCEDNIRKISITHAL